MVCIKMVTFCKSVKCPSSEKLLGFQTGKTSAKDSLAVRRHLSECEFCAAEVEFYARYPQYEEPVVKVDIPPPLYELAHALLSNRHKDFTLLNKLLCDNASFILEKA